MKGREQNSEGQLYDEAMHVGQIIEIGPHYELGEDAGIPRRQPCMSAMGVVELLDKEVDCVDLSPAFRGWARCTKCGIRRAIMQEHDPNAPEGLARILPARIIMYSPYQTPKGGQRLKYIYDMDPLHLVHEPIDYELNRSNDIWYLE